MRKDEKQKQIRKTRHDVLIAQKTMRTIVLEKIRTNTVLELNRHDEWMDICADALMHWGKITKAYINLPGERIHLGSVHTFALKMMDYSQPVVINKYKFEIKKLWEILYKHMLDVFPCALDEALHISKEDEERIEMGNAVFSSDRSLG